jgi:hypothetical protein
MKKILNTLLIISTLLVFSSKVSFSQKINKEEKKLALFLGTNFSKTTNFKTINVDYKNCIIDTSTTLLHDTTGVHIKNEFIQFRDPIQFNSITPFASFLNSNPVSVKEYNEFIKYVEDSIKMEKIVNQYSDDISNYSYNETDSLKVIDLKKKEQLLVNNLRPNGVFNWKCLIDWQSEETLKAISSLTLSQPERFYKLKEFDKRKLFYKYKYTINSNKFDDFKNKTNNFSTDYLPECEVTGETIIVENIINIAPDFFKWAYKTESNIDVYSALAYSYNHSANTSPVIGLLGTQAIAYCVWKSLELQKQIDSLKLPYKVQVSLPTEKDIILLNQNLKLHVPSKDYSIQWRITGSNYKEFIDDVLDSLAITSVYFDKTISDEKANNLIQYSNEYFDDGSLSYESYNPSDRELNMFLFSLNFKNKNLLAAEIEASKKQIIESFTANYRFFHKDFKSMNLPGKFWWDSDESYPHFELDYSNSKFYRSYGEESETFTAGESLNSSELNCLGFSSGIRNFNDLQIFNLGEQVNVLEGIDYNNLSEITNPPISYQQALAYYYWKSKIWAEHSMDNYSSLIFPTEKQFEQIQNGQQIISEETLLKYPTPIFRYTVHFYNQINKK